MNSNITYVQTNRPGCLIQILWFVLVGSWLGAIWVAVAWFLMLTIIGLPISAAMLNNVPQVMALRGRRLLQSTPNGGVREAPETNILIRIVYFLLIGWWLSGVWMVLAYLACLSIFLLPIGFWMFDLTPTIVSLKRS
jgi:uncharacterized membrane protein YccF (DUF307 family)